MEIFVAPFSFNPDPWPTCVASYTITSLQARRKSAVGRRLIGPQSQSGCCGDRKLCLCLEPNFVNPGLVVYQGCAEHTGSVEAIKMCYNSYGEEICWKKANVKTKREV
jgi:hypothetical protein